MRLCELRIAWRSMKADLSDSRRTSQMSRRADTAEAATSCYGLAGFAA